MSEPRQHPVTYLEKDGSFPKGPFRSESPPEVYLAAALADRLQTATRSDSIRYIAKLAHLSPQPILNILNGRSWPDLRTIARLEVVFDCMLWGYEHRRPLEYFNSYRRYAGWPRKPRDYLSVLSLEPQVDDSGQT